MASNINYLQFLKGTHSVCARQLQGSMRQDELGVERRYGMGRAVPFFIMHLGRVERQDQANPRQVDSPRQGGVTSQVQGEPKKTLKKGEKTTYNVGARSVPGNPHSRTSRGRSELRDTYKLTQALHLQVWAWTKALCPWAEGVDGSSRCYFYLLFLLYQGSETIFIKPIIFVIVFDTYSQKYLSNINTTCLFFSLVFFPPLKVWSDFCFFSW